MAPRARTTAPDLPDWLAAREPSLQRTAHLLTEDVDRAQPLVLETLARLRLTWRRVRRSEDIDTEARRLLLAAYRTASRGDLEAHHRAVLVLRHHDGLTDPEIAELIRTSVGSVRDLCAPDPAALARELAEATDAAEYPTTPLPAVDERARAIQRGRRRTALRAGAAGVALVAVSSGTVALTRGDDDAPTPAPVAPLPQLRQGATPGVDYLDGDAFVPVSGDPIHSPALRRASTATPYGQGVLVSSRAVSEHPFSTITLVTSDLVSRVGCGTPSFVPGGDSPAYWLSRSCRADDARRLVEGDTGRLVEGSTRAATTAVVTFTPVGRVADGVVAFGTSDNTAVGNAAYVVQTADGASRLVPHLEVPRGSTPHGDLISGLAHGLTDSLVVEADTGAVRWRLRDWSLGRFSPSGREVVGFASAGLPHLGAVSDSIGIWDAATGHQVLVRRLPGLMLDSLPVWEDEDSVLVVAEDRNGEQAIVRVDTDGTVTRATAVRPAALDGYRLAATP